MLVGAQILGSRRAENSQSVLGPVPSLEVWVREAPAVYSVTSKGMNEALQAPTLKCYRFVRAFRSLPPPSPRPRKEGIEGVQVEWPGHILMVRLGGFQGGGQEWGVGLGGTHT